MGIGGKALQWFRCYLTDAKQRVVWDGQVSDVTDVEYGVRQGSLLGPVLYLLHVFDLPLALEIRQSDGDSGYADDTSVWVVARFQAGRVVRLAQHLPRGQLLRQLGSGLLMGKLAHCLPVVAWPRLPGLRGPIPEALASVQVAINDVARSVVGHTREDHILMVDLLEAAKFLSLNEQVVQATAMAAWNAYVSNDGVDGTRNPVGNCMFGNGSAPTERPTRAMAAGEVRVPTRGMDTLVTHALGTWNVCAELRDSKTKAEAEIFLGGQGVHFCLWPDSKAVAEGLGRHI
jgi:hypothetical protein